VGALILHASAFVFEGGGYVVWDGKGIVSLLYLAIVSSSIGFIIYFTLLERVGPIRSNLVSNIAPIFAALAGLLYLGEPFELRMVLAFGLILLGFLLVAQPWKSPTR
jgi:drug/metabolite transporter (DMT)-like permease